MHIFKKIIVWILLIVVQQFNYCCAANVRVVESYYILKYEYEEFLSPLTAAGAKEDELLVFFEDVEEALNKIDGLSRANIETHLKSVLLSVATYRDNRNLSAIIFMCYQTDIEEYSATGKVPQRLQGLYDAMVKAMFGEDGLDKVELAKIYETSLEAYQNSEAYTEDTIAELKIALDYALSVLKNKDCTESNITDAKAKLTVAYDDLETNQNYTGGGGGGSSGVGGGGVTAPQTNYIFTDLSDKHWSYEAVKYLTENSILSGYEDGSFKPDLFVKREEVARILCAALELENASGQEIFSDVPTDAWYKEYVYRIAESSIMQGVGNGEFGVGLTLTRQDLAVIANRLISEGLIENNFTERADNAEFADISEAAEYARSAISRIKELGIIAGIGDNKFAPKNGVTRAQVAQIIYNLIKQN